MAPPRKLKGPYSERGIQEAFEPFDVTCVLGTITPDPDATETATLAAFRLISEHGAPGVYHFPNEYGGITTVTIDPNAS